MAETPRPGNAPETPRIVSDCSGLLQRARESAKRSGGRTFAGLNNLLGKKLKPLDRAFSFKYNFFGIRYNPAAPPVPACRFHTRRLQLSSAVIIRRQPPQTPPAGRFPARARAPETPWRGGTHQPGGRHPLVTKSRSFSRIAPNTHLILLN